jgi:hypothetical protein
LLLSDGSMTAKEHSARALANLAAGSGDRRSAIIVDAGAVPALVLLLSDGSMTAKEHSARALAKLSYGSDDRRRAIVDAGAVPALVLLLSDGSVTAKEYSARAVCALVSYHYCRDVFIRNGVVAVLHSLAGTDSLMPNLRKLLNDFRMELQVSIMICVVFFSLLAL